MHYRNNCTQRQLPNVIGNVVKAEQFPHTHGISVIGVSDSLQPTLLVLSASLTASEDLL